MTGRIRRRLKTLGIEHFQWIPQVESAREFAECEQLVDRLIRAGRADILRNLPGRSSSARELLTAAQRNELGALPGAPSQERGGPRDLYFIHNPATRLVKIGVARDVDRRLKDLEHICGTPLSVIAVVKGGADYERQLHATFAATRRHGEWFDASDALLRVAREPERLQRVLAQIPGSAL